MSYNVSTWKTKKLENLVIPMTAFFLHEREDWHPKTEYDGNGGVTLECGCEQEITGQIEDGKVTVTEIEMSGEGSGTFINWILGPALERSTGTLEAVTVWEGGDSVSKLTVNNGKVSWEEIEL